MMKKSKRLLMPTEEKAVPSISGMKKDGNKSERKLAGKVIFLDIRDARQSQMITRKLKKLSAVVETFLTKDVNYVISSSDALKSGSHRAQGSLSPAFSNTPSPFHFTPTANATPSPTYVNAEGKLVPLSRGQAMAQMARARNRSPSPSSVVTNAGRLGIKVISLEAADRWLDKELKKLGLTVTEETLRPQGSSVRRQNILAKTRRLKDPFIKVESSTREYRPQFKEMPTWPHIKLDTLPGTCPFDGIGISLAQRSKGISREAPASAGRVLSPSTQSNTQRRSLEGDDSSRLVGVPILTAGDVRRQHEKRKQEQRRRGYCECCQTKYDDIEKHLKEPNHVEFARDKNNYEVLEELISALPTPSEFLRGTLLRHCAEQVAGKPVSVQVANDSESSSDQIFTVNYISPAKLQQPQPSTNPAAPEIGPELTGFHTPTHIPQYGTVDISSVASPMTCQDQPTPREDKLSHSLDSDAEGTVKDPSRLTAVVIRRPGARSAYGSPRDKWSHNLSPYCRDSPHTPKKVMERSMIIGNTSIGSLQSVLEAQHSVTWPSDLSDRDANQVEREAKTDGSSDRKKPLESALNRQREQSTEPSTSVTSLKGLSSCAPLIQRISEEVVTTQLVQEFPFAGTSHKSPQKASSLKKKRASAASEDVDVTVRIKTFDSVSTFPKGVENAQESQLEKHSTSLVNLSQRNRNKETECDRSQAYNRKRLHASEDVELKKERTNQKESKPVTGLTDSCDLKQFKGNTVQEDETIHTEAQMYSPLSTQATCSSATPSKQNTQLHTTQERHKSELCIQEGPDEDHQSKVLTPSLRHTPRKQQPRVSSSPIKDTQTSQNKKHQTPQKGVSHVLEEVGSFPVYMPQAVTTSTPMTVYIHRLHSTESFPADKEKRPSVPKACRRSLLTGDSQPGPSATSSGNKGLSSRDRERSASKGRKILSSRGKEKSACVSKERSVSDSKKDSVSGSVEDSTSNNSVSSACGSKDSSASGNTRSRRKDLVSKRKERSASSSREDSSSGSKERSLEKRKGCAAPQDFCEENEERRTRRRSSRNKKMSEAYNSSKETPRGEGNFNTFHRSLESSSIQEESAQTDAPACFGQLLDITSKDTDGLHIKLVRYPVSPAPQTSTKKVKLSRNWQLLSDNSMSRLLQSETEVSSFNGFHGDEVLPSDLTFESASEVEVTDDEDREWLIDDEELSDLSDEEQGNGSLRKFIPTLSSPGKSNSSWDDACDLYVSQSVEQQLRSRQPCPSSAQKASMVQRKKRKHSSCHRHSGIGNPAKKRRLRKDSESNDKWNSELYGMRTPTKRERRNGSCLNPEGIVHVNREILISCASPKQKISVSLSPLKIWNGNFKKGVCRSPRQSSHQRCILQSQLPPAFKIQ